MSEQLPTVGIEIELPWRTMLRQVGHQQAATLLEGAASGFHDLPDDEKTIVQAGFDEVDAIYDHRVAVAKQRGLPTSGNDGYIEFVLPPRSTPAEVTGDVAMLYDLELLVPENRYPLHLTIGGIASNAAASYLLCSTEIMGDIPGTRVMQRNTWNVKGRGGLKQRLSHDMQLDASKGVEFRTLQLSSLAQLHTMSHVAQTGAAGIIGHLPEWREWRATIEDSLNEAGLPTNSFWQRSDAAVWQRYGELLDSRYWRHGMQQKIAHHVRMLELQFQASPMSE